jgi:hypothetical protein
VLLPEINTPRGDDGLSRERAGSRNAREAWRATLPSDGVRRGSTRDSAGVEPQINRFMEYFVINHMSGAGPRLVGRSQRVRDPGSASDRVVSRPPVTGLLGHGTLAASPRAEPAKEVGEVAVA